MAYAAIHVTPSLKRYAPKEYSLKKDYTLDVAPQLATIWYFANV